MPPKHSLFFAFLLNVLFFLLYAAFGQIRHGSLDDYFMSGILTGAYGGEYDAHLYFVNALYGYFLKPFYWLFPKIGWYFIFELAGTFAAFTCISYIAMKRLGHKWGIAVSALILASLAPDFYFQISFTQCATLYTATGVLSFVLGISSKKKLFLLLGMGFLIAGDVMRHSGFLLSTPYLLFLLGAVVATEKKRWAEPIIALSAVIVIIYGMQEYNKNLYTKDDYKYYAEYQPIRSYFGDGAFYDKESTCDELDERGMSCQDFNMLRNWVFYDTEVFSKDSLEPIKQVTQNNQYILNVQRMPLMLLGSISKALTRPSGWCWVILCFLLLLSQSKSATLYIWFSIGVVVLSIGYLLVVNRMVYHVESGIWLNAIVSSIPLIKTEGLDKYFSSTRILNHSKTIFLAISVLFLAVTISSQDSLKTRFNLIETPQMPNDWINFVEYTQKNPDDVFLLSFEKYKTLGAFKNPAYMAEEPNSWNNIYPLGYWNIHLPAMRYELAKRGVQNPIRDIIHNNVYLVEDGNNPSLKMFHEMHYHKSLSVDTVKNFGKIMLLKYALQNDEQIGMYE